MALGEPLEDEIGAPGDERVVACVLAEDLGARARRPCAVGIAPDFARAVRRFDRAHEHRFTRASFVHWLPPALLDGDYRLCCTRRPGYRIFNRYRHAERSRTHD